MVNPLRRLDRLQQRWRALAFPFAVVHRLVNKGLLAVYCADAKVRRQREMRAAARRLIALGGPEGRLVYLSSWLYRRMSPGEIRESRRSEERQRPTGSHDS